MRCDRLDAHPPRAAPRQKHHVDVVALDDRVWDGPAFRKSDPGDALGKPFVHSGMTGLDPDLRFDRHKAGISRTASSN